MYVTIQRSHNPLTSPAPGHIGAIELEQIGSGLPTTLTVWPTDPGGAYEVEDDAAGRAAGEQPRAAALIYFDGPVSPARLAAARRAGRDRVKPVLTALPGMVRVLVLWQPEEGKLTIVNLATSVEALDAAGRAVNSTELLPGEDPALLTGPDRVDLHTVSAYTAW